MVLKEEVAVAKATAQAAAAAAAAVEKLVCESCEKGGGV